MVFCSQFLEVVDVWILDEFGLSKCHYAVIVHGRAATCSGPSYWLIDKETYVWIILDISKLLSFKGAMNVDFPVQVEEIHWNDIGQIVF